MEYFDISREAETIMKEVVNDMYETILLESKNFAKYNKRSKVTTKEIDKASQCFILPEFRKYVVAERKLSRTKRRKIDET